MRNSITYTNPDVFSIEKVRSRRFRSHPKPYTSFKISSLRRDICDQILNDDYLVLNHKVRNFDEKSRKAIRRESQNANFAANTQLKTHSYSQIIQQKPQIQKRNSYKEASSMRNSTKHIVKKFRNDYNNEERNFRQYDDPVRRNYNNHSEGNHFRKNTKHHFPHQLITKLEDLLKFISNYRHQ